MAARAVRQGMFLFCFRYSASNLYGYLLHIKERIPAVLTTRKVKVIHLSRTDLLCHAISGQEGQSTRIPDQFSEAV